ncbi:hypothetical protein TDB9533_03746 [Thalassocella blandensis]|nr:hypothetical protein TDB9533_03746 [Thalassocella blandensis]
MQTFQCTCKNRPVLFFENTVCIACGRLTGYSEKLHAVVAFTPCDQTDFFLCDADPDTRYKKCANFHQHSVCNGMLSEAELENNPQELCYYCHFNHAIPDLSISENIALWRKLETAKRRTLYTLQGLSLPIPDRVEDPANGLMFKFLADKSSEDHFREPLENQSTVYTGHNAGEITINLSEADDVARHRTRVSMNERYRTLLGHFRHEIGHFYWDQLVAEHPDALALFRSTFGDEQLDYQQALKTHYEKGEQKDWSQQFISAYASSHPWEDWAETWAHYLHMVDTLETAQHYGVRLDAAEVNHHQIDSANTDIHQTIEVWTTFTVMFNSLNRSMGLQDAYPFIISDAVSEKLNTVHRIIRNATLKAQ